MGVSSWQGLFRKEWILLRPGILVLALLNAVVILLGPFVVSSVFGVPQDFYENTQVIAGLWIVLYSVVGVGTLFTSLGHEMKRPDLWLYSPASMFQLVSAKAFFASFLTACLLLLCGALLSISFFFSGVREAAAFSLMDGTLSLVSVLVKVFLISIFYMGIGFFFWSVYQVLRSRLGEFSIIITIILFIAASVMWERIRVAGLFDNLLKVGPVTFTDTVFYNESNSYFFTGIVPGGVVFTFGSLLFYGVLTGISFYAGSKLFEMKVRL